MTSGRKPGDNSEEKRPAATAEGQVERAARAASPAPDGEKAVPPTTKSPEDDPTAEETAAEGVDADLDALLADVQRERDEYLDLARRAKADFENYRKRAARESADAERRGKAALARELVPAIDNLERALRSAGIDPHSPPAGGGVDTPSEEVSPQEALARGLALVYGELTSTLARAGVEAYDPLGERFDPAWHEALSTRAEDGTEAGVVIETLERGYRLDGQVLRPARVVVSA